MCMAGLFTSTVFSFYLYDMELLYGTRYWDMIPCMERDGDAICYKHMAVLAEFYCTVMRDMGPRCNDRRQSVL
jgi:hypothetical protein